MALSLLHLNGERAVVFLYIIRILFSTPISLLPQALSLSLLSLFALSVEISADHADNPLAQIFKTRPGASSGILLGAVTLPGLMLSRLIQILRAVPLQEVGIEELEYLKLQFWAASASCFPVLVFLFIVCRCQGINAKSTCSHCNWNAKYSFICITLPGFLFVSFFEKIYGGWPVALMLLWVFCHGMAAVKLIQRVLCIFPACASIGESLLVTSGLVIYFGDMLVYTAAKIPGYLGSSKVLFLQYGIKRSETSTMIQGMILGLLIFPVFYNYVLRMWEYFTSFRSNEVAGSHEIQRSFLFYASLTFMLLVVVPSWMQFVHAFHLHPLLWYCSTRFHFSVSVYLLNLKRLCHVSQYEA